MPSRSAHTVVEEVSAEVCLLVGNCKGNVASPPHDMNEAQCRGSRSSSGTSLSLDIGGSSYGSAAAVPRRSILRSGTRVAKPVHRVHFREYSFGPRGSSVGSADSASTALDGSSDGQLHSAEAAEIGAVSGGRAGAGGGCWLL